MAKKKKTAARGNQNQITDLEWKSIKKFGQNVKTERLRQNLTLESVEELGYKSWKHWQDIESGNRNISFTTVIRIAKCLKIEPGSLLEGVDI